jgi:hypothetical protein
MTTGSIPTRSYDIRDEVQVQKDRSKQPRGLWNFEEHVKLSAASCAARLFVLVTEWSNAGGYEHGCSQLILT